MGSNVLANKTSRESKLVWIWTENKHVMTTAVERGLSTFVFDVNSKELAKDWSCEFCLKLGVFPHLLFCVVISQVDDFRARL